MFFYDFSIFFQLVCFLLFVSILGAISSFPTFIFCMCDFFPTFYLKESFTLIVDLAFRLPNCLMDLLRNFPQKRFLNWNILLNVIFTFLKWPNAYCNWPPFFVVRCPSCINSCCLETRRLIATILGVKHTVSKRKCKKRPN